MIRREFLAKMAAVAVLQIDWSTVPAAQPEAKPLREGQLRLGRERWDALRALAAIHLGPPHNLVHMIVFFDPNCPWCAQLWKSLYASTPPAAHASTWIPIAYLSDSSSGKALAILRAADPAKALADNFSGYDPVTRLGAIEPARDPTPQERARLQNYSSVWQSLTPASPLIVYRSRDGETYLQVGMPPPQDFAALLKDLPPGQLNAYSAGATQ